MLRAMLPLLQVFLFILIIKGLRLTAETSVSVCLSVCLSLCVCVCVCGENLDVCGVAFFRDSVKCEAATGKVKTLRKNRFTGSTVTGRIIRKSLIAEHDNICVLL